MKTRCLLLLAALSLLTPTAVLADLSNYEIHPDIVYGHKLGMALTMDGIKPKTNANGAAILFMVSGGWVSAWAPPESMLTTELNKSLGFTTLLDKGYTVFLVRHGSSPLFKVPECIEDVRRAARHVHQHAADWGLDPSRLGVYGASAGGHLSLMLGTTGDDGKPDATDPLEKTGDRVAAVVAIFPPTELKSYLESESFRQRFPALQFDAADWRPVSPIEQVTADDAPTLLLHGDQDDLVPDSHSRSMHQALKDKGVASDLIIIPGAGHGFAGADRDRVLQALVAWFDTYLARPKAAAPPVGAHPLVGQWELSLMMGDQALNYALRFEADGNGVKGILVSPRSGEHPVESVTIDKENVTVRIKRNYEGTEVTFIYSGRLENGALAGKVAIEGRESEASGTWSAKRK
jgi:acetyl esterase/lipase